jgi:diguanylate cyclase (GGDEF)-like protein/PAS domain S-box-containing protein
MGLPIATQARRAIDWFVPEDASKDGRDLVRARIFLFSHFLGPGSGLVVWLYLHLSLHVSDWLTAALGLGLAGFAAFPLAMRFLGRFEPVALVANHYFAAYIFLAAYNFGGMSSPLLVWLTITVLANHFYLRDWRTASIVSNVILGLELVAFFAYGLLGGTFPTHLGASDLLTLGLLSDAAIALFVCSVVFQLAAKVHTDQRLIRHQFDQGELAETERLRLEAQIRRSHDGLIHTQRMGRIGSAEVDLVTGETHGSEQLSQIYGLDPAMGEPSLTQLLALVHPDDRARVAELRRRNERGEAEDQAIEFRIVHPDGQIVWVHREIDLIRDASGKPIKLITTQQDVTARKVAEEELRREHGHLEMAQRIAKIGSVEVDMRSGAVKWSDELCRIYGLDPAATLPSFETFIGLVHPDDRKKIIAVDSQPGHGSSVEPFEFRIIRPDGEMRWLFRYAESLPGRDGAPATVIITNEDITDRRRMENEVARGREHLLRAQRTARIGSAEVDLATGEETWSDEMKRLIGTEALEPGYQDFIDAVHPEDRQRMNELRDQNNRGQATDPIEYRIARPDGSVTWVRRDVELVVDGAGKPVRIVATHHDITDRKRVGDALERSEHLLREATRAGKIGIYIHEHNTNAVEWNSQIRQFYGVGKDEKITVELFLSLVHPDDRERVAEAVKKAHDPSGDGRYDIEHRVVRRDGTVRWLSTRGHTRFEMRDGHMRPSRTVGATLDTSETKEYEDKLQRSRAHLARAQRVGSFGSAEIDLRTGAVTWSDHMYDLLGFDRATAVPGLETYLSAIHPQDREMVRQAAMRNREGLEASPMEFRIRRPDSSIRWFSWAADLLLDDSGKPVTVVATVHDVTERRRVENELRERERRLARSERHLALAQRVGGVGSIERNLPNGAAFWSEEFYRLTGLDPATTETSREILLSIVHPDDRHQMADLMARSRLGQHTEPFEFRIVRAGGETRWLNRSAETLRRDDGTPYAYIATFNDITNRKHDEERIVYQANYDNLTGLPNRALFINRLGHALNAAGRGTQRLAVMFVDLDGFKMVNDTLGHDVGDELLGEAARRLLASFRSGDTVARFGGDEFVVLMPGLASLEDVPRAAQRAIAALEEPFRPRSFETFVSASIGIAVYPDDAADVHGLLTNADAAMYRAKEMGKGNFQFFTPGLNDRMRERMAIKQALAKALERNEFELHYQPKIGLETGKVTGVEALIRWNSAELGPVIPERFIPIMEETGMIVEVGAWVIATACKQYKVWCDAGFPDMRVAVNLSVRQLRQPDLAQSITAILHDVGVDPSCLELEITESTIMRDIEASVAILHKLREMGVTIAMDDFGTGYSSLSNLKRLPLHTIKIDRSFIDDIAVDEDNREITRTIVNLGHGLRHRVIAEGVETEEQLALIRETGCDEVQGDLLSRPLPADELDLLLVNVGATARLRRPDGRIVSPLGQPESR